MSRVSRGSVSGDAYLDLKLQAQRTGRPTQELLQLYVLEGFLARLAVSDARTTFVLKGGVLLAAYGSRRPTKDVDLAAIGIANDTAALLERVRRILRVTLARDDGIEFAAGTATAEVIRDDEEYSGVRVHVQARLASAKLPFHIDINVGDPIWPEPTTVAIPRLRGGAPIELPGYPIHMVHAEKIVTAVQRGVANTRWRDFGDIWTLSRCHQIDARDLRQAIEEVARYRNASLKPLSEVLDGFTALAQNRWSQWRRRSNSDHLPEQFATVLTVVVEFADPVLTANPDRSVWDPLTGAWR